MRKSLLNVMVNRLNRTAHSAATLASRESYTNSLARPKSLFVARRSKNAAQLLAGPEVKIVRLKTGRRTGRTVPIPKVVGGQNAAGVTGLAAITIRAADATDRAAPSSPTAAEA